MFADHHVVLAIVGSRAEMASRVRPLDRDPVIPASVSALTAKAVYSVTDSTSRDLKVEIRPAGYDFRTKRRFAHPAVCGWDFDVVGT